MYQGKKEILVNTNFITSPTKQLYTVILTGKKTEDIIKNKIVKLVKRQYPENI